MSTYARQMKSFAAAAMLALAVAFGFALAPQGYAQADGGSQLAAGSLQAQDDAAPTTYDLKPINDERMYVVVKVVLEDNAEGQDYMTYYLNGSSYGYAFSGSQDDAVATWDAEAGKPNEGEAKWAAKAMETIDFAYTAYDGSEKAGAGQSKAGYRLPITIPEGQSQFAIPVVAYSSDFTARRFDVDLTAGTVTTGTASDVAAVTLQSSVADIAQATRSNSTFDYTGYVRPYAGAMDTSGSPLSNDFVGTLTFKLADTSVYDQVYAVTYEGRPYVSDSAKTVDPVGADYATVSADGTVALPIRNEYDTDPKTVQLNGNIVKVMMHVSEDASYTEADTWVERTFQLDFTSRTAATLAITGDALTPVKNEAVEYTGDTYKIVKRDLTSTFGMLSPKPANSLKVMRCGDKIKVEYTPSNKTTYAGIYLGADFRMTDTWDEAKYLPITEDADISFYLDASYAGKAWPIAPVKRSDGGTTGEQYYMAIPALDKIDEYTLEDGVYVLPELASPSGSLFNHMEDDSKFLKIDEDNATVVFVQDGSTKSVGKYSRIALGKSSELVETPYQPTLADGTVIIEGVEAGVGTSGTKWSFDVTLSKSEVLDLLFNDAELYITLWNNQGSSDYGNVPGWYKASNDQYLKLGQVGDKVELADYTAVDAAKAAIPADLSLYTEATAKRVTAAIAATVKLKTAEQQSEVDAMAQEITDAVAALVTLADQAAADQEAAEQAAQAAAEAQAAADADPENTEKQIAAAEANAAAAQAAAVAAQSKANAAVADAAAAQKKAEADKAEAEQKAADAETAKAEAEQRAADAEAAKQQAETDKASAEAAKAEAEQKAADAEKAQKAAETAQKKAEQAQAKAEADAKTAKTAQKAAETAQKTAEKKAAASIKANPMTVKTKVATAKANKKTTLKKAKVFTVKGAKGKVSFAKVSGNAKITVASNGKVVVKKGLKKGKTYKIKVMVIAKGNKSYAPAVKTVTVKVKIN